MNLKNNSYAAGVFGLFLNSEIDWSKELLVSYSQYSTYNTCPKRWELSAIQKKKIPSESIYAVYGSAMHNVIQEYIKGIYTTTVKKADELPLEEMLLQSLKDEYAQAYEKCEYHFSSAGELSEFYADGCAIIKYIKKKRSLYFPRKDMKLIGIELPIVTVPDSSRPSLKMQMYLDVVLYDEKNKIYTIIDIKTSTKGWGDYKKKDKITTDQILLYKHFFAEKFGISVDQVDVKYFIVRQKVDPDSLWPIKRIQEFSPSNGKISLSKTIKSFQDFINECFTANGEYNKERNYPAIAGKQGWNCKFCDYADKFDLCPKENRIDV